MCRLFPKWDQNAFVKTYVSKVKERNTKTNERYERWYTNTLYELYVGVMHIDSYVFVYCIRNREIDTLDRCHKSSQQYLNSYWYLRVYWKSWQTAPLLRICARAIKKNENLYELEELPDELKALIVSV
jgi:hypothetical protein